MTNPSVHWNLSMDESVCVHFFVFLFCFSLTSPTCSCSWYCPYFLLCFFVLFVIFSTFFLPLVPSISPWLPPLSTVVVVQLVFQLIKWLFSLPGSSTAQSSSLQSPLISFKPISIQSNHAVVDMYCRRLFSNATCYMIQLSTFCTGMRQNLGCKIYKLQHWRNAMATGLKLSIFV